MFVSPLFFASGKPAAGIISRVVYAPICHQDPARSFHCCGHPLSVCERCASIYVAFTLAIVFLPLLLRSGKLGDFSFKRFLLFLLPMVLDYGLDVLGTWQNAPLSRSVSGGIAGIGLALFVLPGWLEAWVQLRGGSDNYQKQEVSNG